jgi:hypothetical protein
VYWSRDLVGWCMRVVSVVGIANNTLRKCTRNWVMSKFMESHISTKDASRTLHGRSKHRNLLMSVSLNKLLLLLLLLVLMASEGFAGKHHIIAVAAQNLIHGSDCQTRMNVAAVTIAQTSSGRL